MTNLISRADPRARALGFVNWRGDPNPYTAAAVLTSKQVDVVSIFLPFDVPINYVAMRIDVAAAGTANTGVWFGIGNATKQLAQSANQNTGAGLTSLQTLGIQKFALNAPYIPSRADSPSGLFYVTILTDNTTPWGTTVPQFGRLGLNVNAPATGVGISAGRAGTAQTAFVSNGSVYSTAMSGAAGQEWWAACMP